MLVVGSTDGERRVVPREVLSSSGEAAKMGVERYFEAGESAKAV